MTKTELADGVLLLLGYTSGDKKIKDKFIQWIGSRIIPFVFKQYLAEMPNEVDDLEASKFVTGNVLDIQYDEVRDKYYVESPYYPISLGGRLYQEVAAICQDEAFVMNTPGSDAVYKVLEAGGMFGKIGVTTEGKRLYLSRKPLLNTQLLVSYVKRIEDLEDNEEIPMPAELESIVMEKIYAYLVPQREMVEDLINNERSE
jgi:hypothetical protein